MDWHLFSMQHVEIAVLPIPYPHGNATAQIANDRPVALTMKCQKSLKDEGVDLKTLIMDDNTTTFVRAKTAVSDQLKNCKRQTSHIAEFLQLRLQSQRGPYVRC